MEVVIVPHSQQTQFSLVSREWPVYILERGRSSCKGDASYLPLWFRAFTTQVSTPGFWLQGEDLRQIVMRSPCSFCLGEKQFIRQYCKIFFSKKHPRKLNKPLLSSRSKKMSSNFPPKMLVEPFYPGKVKFLKDLYSLQLPWWGWWVFW